jgi:hypothetical protein
MMNLLKGMTCIHIADLRCYGWKGGCASAGFTRRRMWKHQRLLSVGLRLEKGVIYVLSKDKENRFLYLPNQVLIFEYGFKFARIEMDGTATLIDTYIDDTFAFPDFHQTVRSTSKTVVFMVFLVLLGSLLFRFFSEFSDLIRLLLLEINLFAVRAFQNDTIFYRHKTSL